MGFIQSIKRFPSGMIIKRPDIRGAKDESIG